MTTSDGTLGAEVFTLVFFLLLALLALSLMTRGNLVKWSDLRGVPLFLIPLVYCVTQLMASLRLRRGERVRSFLQFANDLWMRKQRIDGFLPRRPRR